MKGVVHKVYCELYKTELTVCFHKETYEKKFGVSGDFAGCVCVTDGVINIFVEKYECGSLNVTHCAHEAFHAADRISDRVGLEIYPNEKNEHFAYLIEWIVKKIFDRLDRESEWEQRYASQKS